LAPKITKLGFGFETFWRQNFVQKRGRKTLMKLTAELATYRTTFVPVQLDVLQLRGSSISLSRAIIFVAFCCCLVRQN